MLHQFTGTENLECKSLLTTQMGSIMISHYVALQYLYQHETEVISDDKFVIPAVSKLGKDEAQ